MQSCHTLLCVEDFVIFGNRKLNDIYSFIYRFEIQDLKSSLEIKISEIENLNENREEQVVHIIKSSVSVIM